MNLLGQGQAWARINRAARQLRLHHGLLIEGARGTGKSTAASRIAQALLCPAPDPALACGTCPVCTRVMHGTHPDVHVLTVPPDKQDIPIEAVRELQETLSHHALEGRARVAIFDPADRLSQQAQNALLKTLEEPGADTFLLLAATRPEGLLPTVRSRVNRLRLQPLTTSQILTALAESCQGTAAARALAARWSGGALGLALAWIEHDIVALHQQLVGFLVRPTDISAVTLARELLAPAEGKLETATRLRLVLCGLRAAVREGLDGALASRPPAAYVAEPSNPWSDAFDCLLDAEQDLELRITPLHVLTAALLRLQEAGQRLVAPPA